MNKNTGDWSQEHRNEVWRGTRIVGVLMLAVAAWRFVNWGEDPSRLDAGVTILFAVIGGAGAIPGALAAGVSYLVELLPWTKGKG
jgi:hypothetical protein